MLQENEGVAEIATTVAFAARHGRDITPEAWTVIGTTIRGVGVVRTEGDVPLNGTTVPFTENLLRSNLRQICRRFQGENFTLKAN